MKNFLNPLRLATLSVVTRTASPLIIIRLGVALVLSFAIIVVGAQLVTRAQGSDVPSKVSSVSAQPSGSGTVVSIAADNRLGPAQNWWDAEGYHLVFPNTVPAGGLKATRGVRVRRVGTSMEVLLQTKPGARVSLEPDGNRVNLVVDKKLDARPLDGDSGYASNSSEDQQALTSSASSPESATTNGRWSPPVDPFSDLPPEPFPKQTALVTPSASQTEPVGVVVDDEGLAASIFSGTSVFLLMAFGLFGLLISRKFSSRETIIYPAETFLDDDIEWEDVADERIIQEMQDTKKSDPRASLVKPGGTNPGNGSSPQSALRMTVAGPTSLYGAYRIDQEVGKLILGEPHRVDVLASRAIDDRRAIENSLIKGLNSFDLDERAQQRAREALEEYGFVARQCAALLLAPDPFDRTSAARCLGEIKSEDALPFLLEGLYDSESIVRNQSVVSIGELKHPSAIGALLDIARSCPDVPTALLSRTLSACSVEGLDFLDAMSLESVQLGMGSDLRIIEQITHLEPSSSVEELPENCDDEEFVQALELLENSHAQERSEALKTLTQFRVQSCVTAITRVARHDPEPNIRSIAIATLGSIDHESVFPAILVSLAEETREVRASAARALNRLSFDRADAYVRVIETSDEETIREVAQACIQAGIVSQNLDRLGTSDHRQAYETFSLICLLAKAKMSEPILDAIADHSNVDVRIRAVHLLASTGEPGTAEQLRALAARDRLPEEVKTALLVALYKLDQIKSAEEDVVETAEGGTVEASETDSESAGYAVETNDAVETCEENTGVGSQFDFMPVSQPENAAETEVESKRDRFEL